MEKEGSIGYLSDPATSRTRGKSLYDRRVLARIMHETPLRDRGDGRATGKSASNGGASKTRREQRDGDCGQCRMPYRRGSSGKIGDDGRHCTLPPPTSVPSLGSKSMCRSRPISHTNCPKTFSALGRTSRRGTEGWLGKGGTQAIGMVTLVNWWPQRGSTHSREDRVGRTDWRLTGPP
jgi:hypothetical protein